MTIEERLRAIEYRRWWRLCMGYEAQIAEASGDPIRGLLGQFAVLYHQLRDLELWDRYGSLWCQLLGQAIKSARTAGV